MFASFALKGGGAMVTYESILLMLTFGIFIVSLIRLILDIVIIIIDRDKEK